MLRSIIGYILPAIVHGALCTGAGYVLQFAIGWPLACFIATGLTGSLLAFSMGDDE